MKREGYLPTQYPNGAVCNAGPGGACTAGMGTDEEVGKAALVLSGAVAAVAAAPLITSAALSGGSATVIWEGAAAMGPAIVAGGTTIAQTWGGRLLNFVDKLVEVPLGVWSAASRTFANNASGVVRLFYSGPGGTGIAPLEQAIIRANGVPIVTTVIETAPR